MARSSLEQKLFAVLKQLFPLDRIVEQYPVKVKGKILYVDFVLLDKKIAFEIDGEQHDRFVEHFHTDADGFAASKERDRLKEVVLSYVLGFTLIRIKHNEKITRATIRSKTVAALRS